MAIGEYLKDIKREADIRDGNLVYPGKIMGLAPYGNLRFEWVKAFIDYYRIKPESRGHIFTQRQVDILPNIHELGQKIGVVFDIKDRLTGQLAYDIAHTSQYAFEQVFIEIIRPWINRYPGLPICISGGCALNIIANTTVRNEFNREVFVGPNPNDCGITVGMMLDHLRPERPYDATYSGSLLYDLDTFAQQKFAWSSNYRHKQVDIADLARDISRGKIIGIARGKAEHGPRALGNRSIVCDPTFPQMKDILNAKVKHREWYRPFAPVVRLEDVNRYFYWNEESRWMSFCPLVREEWRSVLPSITHIDGSARIQTVTREQNSFIYDLITELQKITGIGVLLNTSFNVDGKPILNTVSDAYKIFSESEIDAIVIEDTAIYKSF
jgi:carbamoyltransferase